jgi:hypothetical protein
VTSVPVALPAEVMLPEASIGTPLIVKSPLGAFAISPPDDASAGFSTVVPPGDDFGQ